MKGNVLCYDKEMRLYRTEYYYEGLPIRRYSSSHIPFLKEIENEGALIQLIVKLFKKQC